MKDVSLAFSSCPNDTFIFNGLVHGLIDTEGLKFDVTLADVETLNKKALNVLYDITKLSFAAFGSVRDKYRLLKAGAAFLVTGDKHLLKLKNYENFEIVKLSAFLTILHQAPIE